MAKITEIEGIGPAYGEKLQAAGVSTVEGLLETAAAKAGRKALAEATGINESLLLTWVNMADLQRIKGIGPQFSELLVAAGVDTVKELATRNAENLVAKLEAVQSEKGLTKAVPSLDKVNDFIAQAKELGQVITH